MCTVYYLGYLKIKKRTQCVQWKSDCYSSGHLLQSMETKPLLRTSCTALPNPSWLQVTHHTCCNRRKCERRLTVTNRTFQCWRWCHILQHNHIFSTTCYFLSLLICAEKQGWCLCLHIQECRFHVAAAWTMCTGREYLPSRGCSC